MKGKYIIHTRLNIGGKTISTIATIINAQMTKMTQLIITWLEAYLLLSNAITTCTKIVEVGSNSYSNTPP